MRSEKSYRMKDLGIEALVGRKVLSAAINDENDLVILETDGGKLFLTWEGGCCSKCYLAHVSGVEFLIGHTIIEAENAEWQKPAGADDLERVVESMGTKIKTDKGYVNFDSRLEHNGYYSGEILVSDVEPMDQYGSPRYDAEYDPFPKIMNPLSDF